MNPDTANLLRELGLPQTEALALEDAADLDSSCVLYLRYRSGSKFENRRVSPSEIKASLKDLEARRTCGDLITCERCYETIAGGVTLIKSGFVYSELVQGHPISLLRRACCGARILRNRDGSCRVKRVVQCWSAEQRNDYIYRPMGLVEPQLIDDVKPNLDKLASIARVNMLIEWMWTSAGFYCCDARQLEDRSFADTIPNIWAGGRAPVSIRCVEHNFVKGQPSMVFADTLDCDERQPAEDGDTIICLNAALLTHFVTRAIAKKVDIYWIDPSNILPNLSDAIARAST